MKQTCVLCLVPVKIIAFVLAKPPKIVGSVKYKKQKSKRFAAGELGRDRAAWNRLHLCQLKT